MKPKTLKSKTPSEVVSENTNVTFKSNGVDTVLKQGVPQEHSRKHDLHSSQVDRVGMNIGLTKNMDNYESLRIDAWYTSDVQSGETLEEAYDRVREIIDSAISAAVSEYAGDD